MCMTSELPHGLNGLSGPMTKLGCPKDVGSPGLGPIDNWSKIPSPRFDAYASSLLSGVNLGLVLYNNTTLFYIASAGLCLIYYVGT